MLAPVATGKRSFRGGHKRSKNGRRHFYGVLRRDGFGIKRGLEPMLAPIATGKRSFRGWRKRSKNGRRHFYGVLRRDGSGIKREDTLCVSSLFMVET